MAGVSGFYDKGSVFLRRKKYIAVFLVLCALLALAACASDSGSAPAADPYAGMVEVASGYGTQIWVKKYDDVPVSSWDPSLFRSGGKFLRYTGSDYAVSRGIDVSEHQAEIDWAAVAAEGVDFAMIRAGYRGYSKGGLYEDEYFRRNLEGAAAQGIKVGVYFFSQAVTVEEAEEEADYVLSLLNGFTPDMPVMFDWESIDGDEARTDSLSGSELTACAVAFCERIRQSGLDAGVYAYRYLAYFYYDLSQLTDYTLWIGAVGARPDFYYKHDIWQYTDSGEIAGINGPVDLNLMLTPLEPQTDTASVTSAQTAEAAADGTPSPEQGAG